MYNVNTKLNATDKSKVATKVTINWETLTDDDIKELAAKTIIIKWQSAVREAGTIPSDATLNGADYKVGTRKPKAPVNVLDAVATMTPEQKAQLLAMLQA